MSSTVRPDNIRAALDAKLAAAMSQWVDLCEAEQPRATLHLNAREIIDHFLQYACRIQPIAEAFGREQAGDLQFETWYSQWLGKLGEADRVLWLQLRDARAQRLIDAEISIPADASVTARQAAPDARTGIPKRIARFALAPERAASAVCADYLRLTKRFAGEFLRDYARFLA